MEERRAGVIRMGAVVLARRLGRVSDGLGSGLSIPRESGEGLRLESGVSFGTKASGDASTQVSGPWLFFLLGPWGTGSLRAWWAGLGTFLGVGLYLILTTAEGGRWWLLTAVWMDGMGYAGCTQSRAAVQISRARAPRISDAYARTTLDWCDHPLLYH